MTRPNESEMTVREYARKQNITLQTAYRRIWVGRLKQDTSTQALRRAAATLAETRRLLRLAGTSEARTLGELIEPLVGDIERIGRAEMHQ
jgi:hypothetical protein